MFAKILCAAALVAAPVPASAPQFVGFPMIKMVECVDSRGTAFFAGGRLISASHVTDSTCSVSGVPLNQVHEGNLDFSSEAAPVRGYRVNCDGFKAGEYYFAVGFAGGKPIQRMLVVMGTGEKGYEGLAVLWGAPPFIPGMSGGPLLSTKGEVVGIVNRYHLFMPISLSRELRDTSLCAGRVAKPN